MGNGVAVRIRCGGLLPDSEIFQTPIITGMKPLNFALLLLGWGIVPPQCQSGKFEANKR